MQRKTVEKDGYSALQLAAFDQADHRMTKPAVGHLKAHDLVADTELVEGHHRSFKARVEPQVQCRSSGRPVMG